MISISFIHKICILGEKTMLKTSSPPKGVAFDALHALTSSNPYTNKCKLKVKGGRGGP